MKLNPAFKSSASYIKHLRVAEYFESTHTHNLDSKGIPSMPRNQLFCKAPHDHRRAGLRLIFEHPEGLSAKPDLMFQPQAHS